MERSEKLKLEKLLGEGSFGIVYQIVDTETNKKFALKRIDFCNQDSDREQAKREADLLSNLRHDHILQYVESFEEEDSLFIVTEYCDRGDLEMYIDYKSKINEKLQENKISIWIYQIASGLHYLHERKILHRDLKTKNIFIMADWSVRIGDLGIAKVLDLGQSKADSFVGTPCYMCPELFEQKPYNNRSDIWSLGCCVYEMMALKKAFQEKAIFKIIQSVLSGRPPAIPEGYSSTLENLVYAMMQKDDFLRPTAFYVMNHKYIQNNLQQTHAFVGYDDDYDQELAEKLKKKKIRSLNRSSNSSSGSGSSLTSWKNITNRIHEMEDEMRRFNDEKVHELINSLELDRYRMFKRKPKVQTGESDSLRESDEEDSGTFVYKGTQKEEDSDSEEDKGTFVYKGTQKNDSDSDGDQGTFVYKGTMKHSSESDDEDTIGQSSDITLTNGSGQNLQEDIVAATLLNRKKSISEDNREISQDDLKQLLRKNPKEAARQIVHGLKKSLSQDEQTTVQNKSSSLDEQTAKQTEEKLIKKKKGGYLKKEARNRKMSDPGNNQSPEASYGSSRAVRLFPRKDFVSYSPKAKDNDQDYIEEDRHHVPHDKKVTTETLRNLTAMLADPSNKTLVIEQITQLQRGIAQDIGELQLTKCYDVMGQVEDDNLVQAVLRELLGPKKYEEYKETLFFLRLFEMSAVGKS